jgi:hypothetical protein
MVAFGLIEADQHILLGLPRSEDDAPALAWMCGDDVVHIGRQSLGA